MERLKDFLRINKYNVERRYAFKTEWEPIALALNWWDARSLIRDLSRRFFTTHYRMIRA